MKQVYLSKLAGKPLIEYLEKNGYKIRFVGPSGLSSVQTEPPVDDRISTHPDIYMCQLGLWENAGLFIGDSDKLGRRYPDNIIYNGVCTSDFFIHSAPHTSPDLVMAVMTWRAGLCCCENDLAFINVKQGYTRCSCLPVDDRSFITSDRGIARALSLCDCDVLLIEPGHISLPGYNYGFIGGCGGAVFECSSSEGRFRQKAIVFNGDLSAHPDFKKICSFISRRNIKPVYFDSYPLEDIGSILAVE